ncbi:unnamed protein product [Prunus armeniaca]
MDSNEVDNSHSNSESDSSSHSSFENDSSSDLDDSPGELLLITKLNAYYSHLHKEPCMTSELSGRQFVIELLNGHPDRHTTHNRMIAEKFQHSKETVSRQFNGILKAICRLGTQIIQPPNLDVSPPKIMENPNYHSWFKINDCICAIDGTHISAWAPASKQIPYRRKYYLVGSGYANMRGFLAPYHGERYHLRDYKGRGKHPRMQSRNDIIFHQYQANDLQVVDEEHIHLHEDNANERGDARDHIARAMWMDYIQNH